jgi:serine/threonine-protein kinase
MLTDHRLFSAKTDFERIRKVLHAPIEPPSAVRQSVPAALDHIVMRALERDRSKRYASAQEMAEEIEAFLETRRTKTDGVRQLLSELFGNEPSVSAERPAIDPSAPGTALPSSGTGRVRPTGSGVALVTATHSLASGPLFSGHGSADRLTGAGAAGPAEAPPPPRPRVLSWVAGAALLVAAVGAFAGLLRNGPGVRSVPVAAVPLPTLATEIGATAPGSTDDTPAPGGTVQIDIQSEPSGAAVSDHDRLLGHTPLTVALPRSSEMAHLRFTLGGFAPQTYDLRPETDGLVFVELQQARRAEAPAVHHPIKKAPPARR